MCIKLPHRDMQFWGTMLVSVLWAIWLHRNHTVFQATRTIPANNLYFSIFYLFSLWTCTPFLAPTVTPRASSVQLTSIRVPAQDVDADTHGQLGDTSPGTGTDTHHQNDEDLLD
jgi:hypothetical protein